MVREGCRQQSVHEVPEFVLLEKFFVQTLTVRNFVAQKVREVLVGDVRDASCSTESFLSVILSGGQHETVIGWHLADLLGPHIELFLIGKSDFGLDKKLVFFVPDQPGDCEYRVVNFELLLALDIVCRR